MKRGLLLAGALIVVIGCAHRRESMQEITDRVFSLATEKFIMMDSLVPVDRCVVTADSLGNVQCGDLTGWTSGFFPGSLWFVYEYTGNDDVRRIAERRTLVMESLKTFTNHHDIGFMMNCSWGNGLRIKGDSSYVEPLVTAANSLCTRFNPTVGCTLSWNPNSIWKYPVIIDNMMNLELLYLASDLSGETKFDSIADAHAHTTARNHFREDYSTFHVVDYDPETGEVLHQQTAQGCADSSAWARGQSWGLYGYAMAYRMTGNSEYLDLAKKIAAYIMGRLPEDGIPIWDYDAPGDVRDASAGAIAASAFLELFGITGNDKYRDEAETILRTLASPQYLASSNEYAGFLLKHSVGSLPGNSQVDVPLPYADYYFLEALIRYHTLCSR